MLSDGTHTLRVEVKDSIAPVGTASITFKVDKSKPTLGTVTISSSSNSITVAGSATDSGAGLDSLPYRFTIGNKTTEWISSNTYTCSGLTPNTYYDIKFEARDATAAKHTAVYVTGFYTMAEVPNITITSRTQTSVEVTIADNNPTGTNYQIVVGDKYVTQSGSLVNYETWITLNNKKITVTGLSPDTSYVVKARARNGHSAITNYSSAITATTLPLPPSAPADFSMQSATQTSITLNWTPVVGALSYDIERIDPQSGSKMFFGVSRPFTDVNLMANKSYQYRIRAENAGGYGEWSETITVSTLPYPPGAPTGLSAQLSPGTTRITWNELPDATSYDVYINGSYVATVTSPVYEHKNLLPDTQYTYQILGKNTGGTGPLSEEFIRYSLPNLPVNASIESVTNTSIQVAWVANGNPSSVKYKIGAFDEQDVLVKETQPSYDLFSVLTGLTPSTNYYIKIKAINSENAETEWLLVGNAETLPNPPDVPVGITAVSRDTGIILRWNEVDGAESYDVELNGAIIASDIAETSFTHTGLVPETTYQYRIRAKNAGGNSEWSSIIQKTTLPPLPDTPANISTSAGSTSIIVTWDAITLATGYDIEVDGQIVNAGASTQYVHNGLTPGSIHYYRVRARNEAGKSPWSQLVSVSTIPNPPLVPGNISTTSTDTSITISWDGVEGAQSYILEADGVKIYGLTDTAYVHSGLAPGTAHYYRVKAVNAGGESDWSIMYEAATQEILSGAPVIIIGEITENSIEISWNEIEGAIGYELETDGVVTVMENQTSSVHTGLEAGTLHHYRVRPLFEEETGQWSTIVSAQTLPGNIDNVEVNATKGSILLTWEAVNGATGYVVEIDGTETDVGAVNRYLHENLLPGTDHVYRVKARNLSGCGTYSQQIHASTLKEISYEPTNILATSEADKIILAWDIVAGASGYQIEIDGETMVDVEGAVYVHEGLLPGTQHLYRIRSVIEDGFSEWSEAFSAFTLPEPPDAPEITDTVVTDSSVTISWTAVSNATAYEVEADGVIVQVGQTTSYLDYGLPAQSQHRYRVRAIGEGGISLWSAEKEILTLTGVPGVPINLTVTAYRNAIQFSWSAVTDADEYEVEMDGVIEAVGSHTSVIFDELLPGTIHTLRVRAVNEGIAGPWSGQMTVSTLLDVPSNINSHVNENQITFYWDPVPGANGYDIRIDGVLIENITGTSYTTGALTRGTKHLFSVRARNGVAVSDWSDTYIQNTPGIPVILECTEGEEFDLYLSANDIDDFRECVFSIEYDPAELELIDLCSLTPELEKTAGNISGTNIRIVSVSEGKVVFTLSEYIDPGNVWTGTVNVMKFKAKLNGQVTVSYSIQ